MAMDKKAVGELIAAYKQADVDFTAANGLELHLKTGAYARIIGALQGSISLALIAMGEYERFKAENGRNTEEAA